MCVCLSKMKSWNVNYFNLDWLSVMKLVNYTFLTIKNIWCIVYGTYLSDINPDRGMPMNWPKLLIDPTMVSLNLFSSHIILNYKMDLF